MSEGSVNSDRTDVWHDVPTLLAAAHELKSPLVLIRQLSLELQQAEPTPRQLNESGNAVDLPD